MITIHARNVNNALYTGAQHLRAVGIRRDSRNGPVLVAPGPVTTVYQQPDERVMLHPGRDANPFFHLVEALWMVAGRDDLATLTKYVKTFANFSDDGRTVPGAYGKRWRDWFHRTTWIQGNNMSDPSERREEVLDQLDWVIKRLKADPNDRRCVIQMWDPEIDMDRADNGGRDVPCNLTALPSVSVEGWLDLTVFCRSNDMVWGAYGANAVHFSVLQELIAAQLGIPVGRYYQVSNNFHAYTSTLGKAGQDWPWSDTPLGVEADPYALGQVEPYSMFGEGISLPEITDDIERFLDDPARPGLRLGFLRKIGCPVVMAHRAYKGGDVKAAFEILNQMPVGNDWRAGAELWLTNRVASKRAQGGVQ